MWVKEIMSSSGRKQGKRRADEYRTERFKKKAELCDEWSEGLPKRGNFSQPS
jgi:hypothetical protein